MFLAALWALPGCVGVTEALQRLPRARHCKSHSARKDAQLDKITWDIDFQGFAVMISRV